MKQYLGQFELEFPLGYNDTTIQQNQKLILKCDECIFDQIQAQNGKIQYKIQPSGLWAFLQNENEEDVIKMNCFYSEIWCFLINYQYVSLDIIVKDINKSHFLVNFKVYLLPKSFQDKNGYFREQNKDDEKQLQQQNKEELKQKLIQIYVKECFFILFEILNINIISRATLRPKNEITLLNQLLQSKYKKLTFYERNRLKNTLLLPKNLNQNQSQMTQNNLEQFHKDVNNVDEISIQIESKSQNKIKNEDKDIFNVNEANSQKFFECQHPQNLKTKLFHYQAQAIQWMLYREQKITADELNLKSQKQNINQTWTTLQLENLNFIYYNEFSGQFSNEIVLYKETQGGILADTMGLGKTICSIGLILLSKQMEINALQNNTEEVITKKIKSEKKRGKTLLIVQLSIFDHWIQEIKKHSTQIEYFEFYNQQQRQKNNKLEVYDVVLTTYGILKEDYKKDKILFNYQWERIILDEAHTIKSKSTLCAKAAQNINANYRWCLTGTPIQNSLDDLFSLFQFLKIDTFSEYHWFNHYINKQTNMKIKFDLLHKIIEPILLRRTKESQDILKTLNLPAKQQFVYLIKFNQKEREFYDKLYFNVFDELKKYYNLSSNKKQRKSTFIHIFQLLSNLRQCCDHAGLLMNKFQRKLRQSKQTAAEGLQNYIQLNNNDLRNVLRREIENLEQARQNALEDMINQQDDEEVDDDESISDNVSEQSTNDTQLQEQQVNQENQVNQQIQANNVLYDNINQIQVDINLKQNQLERLQQNLQNPQHLINTQNNILDRIDQNDCSVCLESLKKRPRVFLLSCEHLLCENCFDALGKNNPQDQQNKECPECRRIIKKDSHLVLIKKVQEEDLQESSKINEIIKYVQFVKDKNEKVVIFTQWISIMNYIQGKLRINGIEFRQINGKMDKSKRNESIEQFRKNQNITAMTISLKAGAYGINLSCANHVLLVDPWWNPAVEDQAIERVHRIGQNKAVKIIHFICENTIEMKVLEMHKKKRQLFKDALQLKSEIEDFNFQRQLNFIFNEKFS